MPRLRKKSIDNKGYITPPIPPEGDFVYFCVPCPNEPQNIENFLGAIQTLALWSNYKRTDDKRGKRIADIWRDIYIDLTYSEEICKSTDACRKYGLQSPRITWFPENPFSPNEDIPEGYTYHPYTVVNDSVLGTLISQWGFGYKVGDVYTDLTKIPIATWLPTFIENLGNLPSFTITDLVGTGVVKITLLNIVQGGRALIQVDNAFNPLNLRIVELNKELSLPVPETETPIVVEVEINTEGTHEVKVTFVPTVDVELIPVFFGGGVRQIEICGFGVTEVFDPCCPETNEVNYQNYVINQQFIQQQQALLDDGDTAASFNAPENFDTDSGDSGGDVAARRYALCRLVKQYIATELYNQALPLAYASSAIAALINFVAFGNPLGGMISHNLQNLTTSMLQGMLNDCQAITDVACCMIDGLSGQPTTIDAIAHSLDGCGFTFPSNAAQIAGMVANSNRDAANARAFIAAMRKSFDDAKAGSGGTEADCNCECCEPGQITLGDFAGTGCQITYIGNCVFKFYQPNPVMSGGNPYYWFSFQDVNSKCLFVENTLDPDHPTDSVGTNTTIVTCDGISHNFVGGFEGGDSCIRSAHWFGAQTTYYKIHERTTPCP